MIPLILRLKRAAHREIAKAQDLIVEELYSTFNDTAAASAAVLHGGTAIWRCYGGSRFSEDIDAYLPKNQKKIDEFFEALARKGFVITKKKIGENSIYSSLQLDRCIVRFEAIFKKTEYIIKEYEKVDGTFIPVYTLTPEEFINEKVNAYLNRLKIRDLYDIFFLLKFVKDKASIINNLKKLTDNFKKPIDEEELKIIILEGIVPTADKMMHYIKSFIK